VTLNMLQPASGANGAQVALLAFALMTAGLVASFFHLGHPERAWRAAAMWRTSWLSREVIALPLAMGTVFVFALLRLLEIDFHVAMLGKVALSLSTLVGFVAVLAILALFACTAMIYASLKFLRQWYSPLTVLNFFLMGTASGFTLATLLAVLHQSDHFDYFSGMAIFLTLAALASRLTSLARNRRLRSPTTLQSAIGVRHPKIRQIAQGAMGGSFNTRAFMHTYGPAVVLLARRFFLLAGFAVPLLLLLVSDDSSLLLCALALLLQFAGLLTERWYFFIEAEHPQNVYYQMIS